MATETSTNPTRQTEKETDVQPARQRTTHEPVLHRKTSNSSVATAAGPACSSPSSCRTAFKQSLVMLRPDIQWKNPVMFVVEVGTVLTIIYTVAKLLGLRKRGRHRLPLGFGLLACGDAAVRQLRLGHRRGSRQGPGRCACGRRGGPRRLVASGRMGPSSRRYPRNSAPAIGSKLSRAR